MPIRDKHENRVETTKRRCLEKFFCETTRCTHTQRSQGIQDQKNNYDGRGGVHEKPVKHKTALHETASLLESSVLLLLCLLELRQEGPDLAEQLELPAALVGPVLRRGRSLPDEPEEPEEAAET